MGGRLDGRVCVVTGAGQGIGRGSAREMAKEGGIVVVSDRNTGPAEETVGMIADSGGKATFVHCDVRKREDVEALMQTAASQFGRIDVLHNNVGIHESDLTAHTAVHELPDEIWETVYEVNLRSIWYAVRAALPFLQKSRGASIVNTASMASIVAMPHSPAYNATKGGVLMLTKQMAVDLARFNIRVNCVEPGTINTPAFQRFFEAIEDPEQRAMAIKGYTSGNLIPRLGEPEEVGKLVSFLASDDASFITGGAYLIDGGLTAWRGANQ